MIGVGELKQIKSNMMSDIKPLVSVVMPVFNASLYLDEAIESVLWQTLPEFELIIINDGSTDNSFQLLKQWEKKDSRIKVYDQENKGRSITRNRGLELATTEYIAMMDADDISMPNRLKLCYEFLMAHKDVVAVSGQYKTMCMYGVSMYKSSLPLGHEEIERDLLQDKGDSFTQGAAMIIKSVAKKVGGYNSSYELGEDADLFLKMALEGKLQNLSVVLLKYRQHASSITNTMNKNLISNCIVRVRQAWIDRELQFDDNFEHYLESVTEKKEYNSYLKWGWNALAKGELVIARRYAIKLLLTSPFHLDIYRFVYCSIRGR